jgi:hypothetical protein
MAAATSSASTARPGRRQVEQRLAGGVGQGVGHGGRHEPGRDDVDGDALAGDLAGERLREADQPALEAA